MRLPFRAAVGDQADVAELRPNSYVFGVARLLANKLEFEIRDVICSRRPERRHETVFLLLQDLPLDSFDYLLRPNESR